MAETVFPKPLDQEVASINAHLVTLEVKSKVASFQVGAFTSQNTYTEKYITDSQIEGEIGSGKNVLAVIPLGAQWTGNNTSKAWYGYNSGIHNTSGWRFAIATDTTGVGYTLTVLILYMD